MLSLYPAIKPYAKHQLTVDQLHTLHIEECGDPEGIPILYLHGGPGSCCSNDDRRFFDPEKYRIILFDQRGSGQSTPHAEIKANTTAHLISDIEAIRQYLNISQWLLFAGSWGTTLALAYSQQHPKPVLGMILRGVFLGRTEDIQWIFQRGASQFYPEHWQQFLAPIDPSEHQDLVKAYYQHLTSHNDLTRMAAAKAWSVWEAHCASLQPNHHILATAEDPHYATSIASLECHYFNHHCFLQPNQLLENIDKIRHIPGIIIHGRYDMICPLQQAWELYQVWPEAELDIICSAGHAAHDPPITDALVRATDKFAEQFA